MMTYTTHTNSQQKWKAKNASSANEMQYENASTSKRKVTNTKTNKNMAGKGRWRVCADAPLLLSSFHSIFWDVLWVDKEGARP